MSKKLLNILILCLLSISSFGQGKASKAQQASPQKPFTVVIDAGHGGHDPGAVGKIVQEKTLNLDVAQRLAQLIQLNYPDVKVVLTRKTDVFLTLQQRADIVNKNKADLFVCIHTNSAENRSVTGTETFVLGVDKMQSNLDVAMRENAVMLLEDDYQTTYEGFDPNSIDSYIMFELMQDQYFDQSLSYATVVQQEFTNIGRSDRGVRQAGFWVLHKSACPSVLIEMGFLSNANEEKFLASDAGKSAIANSIYNAFVSYKSAYDKRKGITPRKVEKMEVKDAEKASVQQTENAQKIAEQKSNESPMKVHRSSVESPHAETTQKTQIESPTESTSEADKKEAVLPVYRIQIFTTTKLVPEGDATFKGLKGCRYTRSGNFYKYTYGEDVDYQTMVDIQHELKSKFKDCFIVAFLGDKQISVKEARAYQQM